ncbi:SpoIIE family protein phosphatase [Kineococcus terrestris]|uniref:SpoIIE family protein phosphatase n=1 Tax=Kineococcus terrestris TaxID=2044856 RepID=UPI0034DB7375
MVGSTGSPPERAAAGRIDDPARVRAARRLAAAPPNPALQRLAALAARLLVVPAAQVSLLTDVQTVSAVAGQDPALVGSTGPLPESLCTVAAAGAGALVVEDAAADERVASLPPVRSGAVGAYLGVPLVADDGHVVGALCVFDPAPRAWRDTDVEVLTELAAAAVAELELSALSLRYESDRLRWQLAVAAGGVGSFDWDLRTGDLVWDAQMLALFGLDEESFDGRIETFVAGLHPDDRDRVDRALREAVDTCGAYQAEYRVVLPGGGTRWVEARGEALAGADGRAARVIGAAYDTTAGHEGEARVARVLESMSAAFYALDREWRFTYVNAEAERLLQRGREELLGGVLWELFPGAAASEFEREYRRAVATGEPVTFEAHYAEPLDGWFEVRAWPAPDGLSVYFLDVTARRAAQEQAERERAATAQALRAAEGSRLLAEEARRTAERTAGRLALLARVSDDLSATLEVEEAAARLAAHLVPALGDWCLVTLVQDSGALRDIASRHGDEARVPLLHRYAARRLAALDPVTSPVARAVAGRRTVVVPEPAAEAFAAVLHDPVARDLVRELAPGTAVVVPMRARGQTIGVLTLCRDAGRPPLAGEDLLTVEDVAERAGLALDNARLYGRQQRMAEAMQRSLLTAPVQPDHLQVVVRYRAAARAAQVGGDWYDAFLQPDGATVLVIGDVMGHDVDAAAAMSQVRSLLRGIAHSGGGAPAEVLAALDATMVGLGVDTTATAVVARLEQTGDERERGVSRMRWSSAGHPPPVLLAPDGTVRTLAAERHDLLLGIAPDLPRTGAETTVERGSTVLLYTDGLVERRGQDLDTGLVALRAAVADLAGEDLDVLCDGVLDRLLPERPEDDVALVAVRLHPQDRPRPPVAGPNRVPPARPLEPGGA